MRHAPGHVGRAHPAGLARRDRPGLRRGQRRDPAPRRHRSRRRRWPTSTARPPRTRRCARSARLSGDERWERLAAELRERLGALGPEAMAVEPDGTIVAGRRLAARLAAVGGRARRTRARGRRRAAVRARRAHATSACARCRATRPCSAPACYHRGSVWPFDSWLGWGGLRAAGREAEAERVRTGVLAALERARPRARALRGRRRRRRSRRVPLANRVQAWTVGARWALEQPLGRPRLSAAVRGPSHAIRQRVVTASGWSRDRCRPSQAWRDLERRGWSCAAASRPCWPSSVTDATFGRARQRVRRARATRTGAEPVSTVVV